MYLSAAQSKLDVETRAIQNQNLNKIDAHTKVANLVSIVRSSKWLPTEAANGSVQYYGGVVASS